MISVIFYSPKFKKQTISLVKKVLEKEFKLKVNPKKRADLYNIEEYYQKQGGNFWIALDKGIVIGTVGLRNMGKKRGFLKRMYVSRKYRGKGIAKNLFLKLLDFAKKNKYKNIFAPTIEEMIAANKFYQKQGFKRISSLPSDFYLEEDKLFYKLDL